MSTASHLGIRLSEYDRRIRTFIPHYEEMLDAAAALMPPRATAILDLGTGTGALAAHCLRVAPRARVTGIDSEAAMLVLARKRLGPRANLVHSRFEDAAFPPADAVVTSLALHHIFSPTVKMSVYRRIRRAIRPGGLLIFADCFPAAERSLRRAQERHWVSHVCRSYSRAQALAYYRGWRREDHYKPLGTELEMLRSCGFHPEVAWRRGMFAVLAAHVRRPS